MQFIPRRMKKLVLINFVWNQIANFKIWGQNWKLGQILGFKVYFGLFFISTKSQYQKNSKSYDLFELRRERGKVRGVQ